MRFAFWSAIPPPGVKAPSPHQKMPLKGVETEIPKPNMQRFMRLAEKFYRGKEGAAAFDLMACIHPNLLRRVSGYLKKSDILQAEQIWSAPLPLAYGKAIGKINVLDEHNCEALLARRMADHVSNPEVFSGWIRYVTVLERLCLSLADSIVVTSNDDRESLRRIHGISGKRIEVIPNGTNTSRYRPDPEVGLATRRELGLGSDVPVLAYVGRYSYPPNRLAIEYIQDVLAPEIWKTHPEARFMLVSRQVPERRLRPDPRIIDVTGEDDFPYISAADVCLAPLKVGGGTRIKVLNYMACGKAVVSTPVGCEGISVANGRELLIAEEEDFAAPVRELLNNASERSELGARARAYVESSLSWRNAVASFDRLHQRLLTAKAG